MVKAKKVLSFLAIGSTLVAIGLLIASIFGLNLFTGVWLKALSTLATVAIASIFAINAVSFIKFKRTLAMVCLVLIGALAALSIILDWVPNLPAIIMQITWVLALATVFFNIIVTNVIKLGSSHSVLQAITYILIVAIDVVLSLLILDIVNLFVYNMVPELFATACLVVLALLITLLVLSKKSMNPEGGLSNDGKMITISVEEYNFMKAKIADLESKLNDKN